MELVKNDKNFEMPEAKVILFDNEDVITASNEGPFVPANNYKSDS